MIITRVSAVSGKVRSIDLPITRYQYIDWLNGKLIQNAFPNLTDDQREFILSGITKDEWDEIFKREDEDDDC